MLIMRALVLFIVLTGLVHIFSVVATPLFAGQKIWQRVTQLTQPRKIKPLEDHFETVAILGQADPSMAYALCHFSLENGPVTVTAEGPTLFWNATLFNQDAEAIYSLHDDVSQTNQLNLYIVQAGSQPEATTDNPVDQITSDKNSDSVPTPNISPLADETDEQELTDIEINEEDESLIRARVTENQVFIVLKVFKASRHHTKLIEETFEAAQCK